MQVIETPVGNITTEPIDDVPLLVAQLQKMGVAPLLDKHFPSHGNWQGLSIGNIVVLWLTYILSQGDHRLNALQGWVAKLLETLKFCMGFRHWFSRMGFCYAVMGIIKSSSQESCLSRIPSATAGTFFVVK